MASYIFIIIKTMDTVASGRKTEWLNVQKMELKSQSRRRLGRWLDAQTNKANACNWKLGSTNAPEVMYSAKY
jgi:hypothetical protein